MGEDPCVISLITLLIILISDAGSGLGVGFKNLIKYIRNES